MPSPTSSSSRPPPTPPAASRPPSPNTPPAPRLHGPFDTEAAAADYVRAGDPERTYDLVIADHRLDDGYGIELARIEGHALRRWIFLADDEAACAPYRRQVVAAIPRHYLERDLLPSWRQEPGPVPPAFYLADRQARAIYRDLRGDGPVYRTTFLQVLESDDEAYADRLMLMTTTAIAQFYEDEGKVWASAMSTNLNPTPHALDELEADLDPGAWCRISDRQLIHRSAVAPSFEFPDSPSADGRPVELDMWNTAAFRSEVDPGRFEAVRKWFGGREAWEDRDLDGFDEFDVDLPW